MRKVAAALVLVAGCSPTPGRFCPEDGPKACWDLDFEAKVATSVLESGERAPSSLALVQVGDRYVAVDEADKPLAGFEPVSRNVVELRVADSEKVFRLVKQ